MNESLPLVFDDSLSKLGDSPTTLLKTSQVYKKIFESESPEQVVRQLPAQLIYLAVIERGITSSSELLEILPLEKVRAILDFDLWRKDELFETSFWEWMRVTDATGDIALLHRIVSAMDLKIIAMIFGRYVTTTIFDESTDAPPGPDFYTPDGGSTWISVTAPDSDTHFLLSRLLALIYEGSPNLFNQLLSLPQVWTESMLQEEAFNDRSRRLIDEGIPDTEYASQIHSPLSFTEIEKLRLTSRSEVAVGTSSYYLAPIEPLFSDTPSPALLHHLVASFEERDDFLAGFSLLSNAAAVFFRVDMGDTKSLALLVDGVKSALLLSLEDLGQRTGLTPIDLIKEVGITLIYRYGLGLLLGLRRKAFLIPKDIYSRIEQEDPKLFVTISGLRYCLPLKVDEEEGTFKEPSFRGIWSLTEYYELLNELSSLVSS